MSAGFNSTGIPLPQLIDTKGLMTEMGITRAAAEALIRHLPVVVIPGLRKTLVRRSDVLAFIDSRTFTKGQVPV